MFIRFCLLSYFAVLTLWFSEVVLAAVPNVVILLTDDQGTLDANCYGSTDLITPNIDRLAASGVRFTQAYSHTVCCPTRAALLTGRYPQRSNVNSWTQRSMNEPDGINMAREEITIAESLRSAGYKTALFGKWHLGAHRDYGPTKQGFDRFFGIRDGFIDNYNHFHLHGNGFHDLFQGTQEFWARGKFFPEMVVSRSLQFIEQNHDQPFFLYLALNIPHYPEQALPVHASSYQDMPEPRRKYASFVTTTDDYIGQVLDKLDSLDLYENTIVIFMSDNGHSEEDYQINVDGHNSGYFQGHNYGANGGGGNTGKWIGCKGTFLEGGIRVPAIISYPSALPTDAVRDQTITCMDWFPTVLELCGIEPPNVKFDGRSVLSVIQSEDATSPHRVLHFQWQNKWAVREGDWKLIRKKGSRPNAKEIFSLHSLSDSEPEVVDHYGQRPEIVARLKKIHDAWATDVFAGKREP